MKRIAFSLSIFIISLILNACSLPAQGPRAWLDRPIDNTTFPLGSITIQAHASDSDGVAMIEFFVEDQLLSSVDVGGNRLVDAAIEWTASEPGTYVVKVVATDNGGNLGGAAFSTIHINGDEPESSTLDNPTPTPELNEVTETPTIVVTETAGPTQTSTPFIPTATFTLVPTLVPTITQTPVPTADVVSPVISFADASPDELLKAGPGCAGSARTTTVTVIVTDAGGIGSVYASWGIGAENGIVFLTFVGSDTYEGIVGPVNETGTLTITINAEDSTGNPASAGPLNVNVQACIT